MHLHVAQQDAARRAAVDLEVEDRRMERFLAERVEQIVVVELDRDGLIGAAVDDAGNLAGTTKAAARTRTLRTACGGDDFHGTSPGVDEARPRPDGTVFRGLRTTQRGGTTRYV